MKLEDQLLFTTEEPFELGLGFHNVGSGVLRYSNEAIQKTVEKSYAQRCGHIPMNAKTIGIITEETNEAIKEHAAYLSHLYGREVQLFTPEEVKQLKTKPFIVPYITVPEVEEQFSRLEATLWGIPGKMTHVLKNKSEFYRLSKLLAIEEFRVPDYTTTYLAEVIPQAKKFLKQIQDMYKDANVHNTYPLGIVMRAADEESSYGYSLMYERGNYVVMIPNGEPENSRVYGNWEEALVNAKAILTEAMHVQKEPRVVISRYIDTIDTPGMSVVILNGNVYSLGWNSQHPKTAGRCQIVASTYNPADEKLQAIQKTHEQETADIFAKLLRETARRCKMDLHAVRGIANIDIMIPTELEYALQKHRGLKQSFYYNECNPRWTAYTDAIMTVLAANNMPQTVTNMRKVIANGIAVVNKYRLPKHVDPVLVRTLIAQKDRELAKEGTRIICHMTNNPMGVIYTGDSKKAEAAMKDIVKMATEQAPFVDHEYFFQ